MNMKKIEAETLEEAYKNAAKELNCSVTEINYEIVQYPATGMMGLFKKPAIIIAVKKVVQLASKEKPVQEKLVQEEPILNEQILKPVEEKPIVKEEEVVTIEKSLSTHELLSKEMSQKEDKVLDSFFESNSSSQSNNTVEIKKVEVEKSKIKKDSEEDFFEHAFDDDRDSPQNRVLSIEIEKKLKVLFASSCFEIDTVEVDVFNNTVHMFVDGEDAALLIGKEGYRYNALSYMLFNWINAQYDLYIKLEIAEFIQTQEEMIENYLKPIIEHINVKGRGKTKPLDGILVQIALEQLRATFPNKYVAIKTGKDGNKFIIINNFNNKRDV
jgi:spoIIIJ-associated protein